MNIPFGNLAVTSRRGRPSLSPSPRLIRDCARLAAVALLLGVVSSLLAEEQIAVLRDYIQQRWTKDHSKGDKPLALTRRSAT
jgi:hypothetical protein